MKIQSLLILLFVHCLVSAQDFSKLFESLDPSVVTIQVTEYVIKDEQFAKSGGLGSGVIIDKDGSIFTASHVVEFANEISVKLHDGTTYIADVISSSSVADIALIKLRNPPVNLRPVKLSDSDKAKIGEQVIVIGAPLGLEHSLSVGHISRKMKRNTLANGEVIGFIQTDASINQGNSGGPMFNTKGELIGIVSFILSQGGGFEGLGFAVDINTARKALFDVNSFWTGFDGVVLTPTFAEILNTPQQSGVLVQRVRSGSFADIIGIRGGYVQGEILGQKLWLGGDIILSIQGLSCNTPHDLGDVKKHIEKLDAGEIVSVTVLRKGKVIELEAKL